MSNRPKKNCLLLLVHLAQNRQVRLKHHHNCVISAPDRARCLRSPRTSPAYLSFEMIIRIIRYQVPQQRHQTVYTSTPILSIWEHMYTENQRTFSSYHIGYNSINIMTTWGSLGSISSGISDDRRYLLKPAGARNVIYLLTNSLQTC